MKKNDCKCVNTYLKDLKCGCDCVKDMYVNPVEIHSLVKVGHINVEGGKPCSVVLKLNFCPQCGAKIGEK